jgi:hypothetical protein
MSLKSLFPLVENDVLIPDHQFGIMQRHSTIEHTHQMMQGINEALENE